MMSCGYRGPKGSKPKRQVVAQYWGFQLEPEGKKPWTRLKFSIMGNMAGWGIGGREGA